MNYAELIRLYFERSSALQWYWTLYVVIIGGLLAFSSLRQRSALITTILVSILYACFAYKNLGAIEDVTRQRIAVREAIRKYSRTMAEPLETDDLRALLDPELPAPAYEGTRNFHVSCDVLTLAAIWAMELRRRRIQRDEMATAPPKV
jgi:hypothetical protein